MALCRLLRLPVLALVWLMMQVNPVLTGIDDWHEAVETMRCICMTLRLYISTDDAGMSMHGMHGCSHLSVVLPGVVLAPLLLQGLTVLTVFRWRVRVRLWYLCCVLQWRADIECGMPLSGGTLEEPPS